MQLQLEPQLLDVAIGEQSGTIERVERGDKRLGASQLYNLAVVLGVGVPYFFADDNDDEDQKIAELPSTDHKALSEAKRFARAVARIPSLEIKHMIADLLKSLVSPKEIPAIVPPADEAACEEPASKDAVSEDSAPDGPSPCAKTPHEGASGKTSDEHWRLPNVTEGEGKRAP